MDSITLIQPDDWHLHLRDGDAMRDVLPDSARQFGRAIIMPNLRPPVTTVADALAYQQRIRAALPLASAFEPLMTLYLTDRTSPEEVARAAHARQVALTLEHWQGLGELGRFALCKLARPGHDHHNLDAAFEELLAPGPSH